MPPKDAIYMDYLKPPTDNLYKFITLSGLVLLVASQCVAPHYIEVERRTTNASAEEISRIHAEVLSLYLIGVDFKVLDEIKIQTSIRNTGDPPPTDEEQRKNFKQLDDMETTLLQLSNIPRKDDKKTTKLWKDVLGLTEEQYSHFCSTMGEKDNPIVATVALARHLRQERLPKLYTAYADHCSSITAGNRYVAYRFYGTTSGIGMFMVGAILWFVRVQRHEDVKLAKEASS